MPFVILFLGLLLVIVAYQGTHTQLLAALKQDLPGFFKWAVAISAIMGLGYVPGLQKPSRYLLGLVLIVIFLANYKQIVAGFSSLSGTSGQASTDLGSTSSLATNPTASYSQAFASAAASAAGETTPTGQAVQVASSAQGTPTQQIAAGVSSGTAPLPSINPTDPALFLAMFHSPSVGFGGQTV
jgi:hypothetical protein